MAVQAGAFIAVPLIKGERLVACLCATDASRRDWTQDEVELVWNTGERTWAAVERARAEAATFGLEVDVRRVGRWEPAPTDDRMRAAFARAAAELGLTTMDLPSGAGHDAQALAQVTPSGMVFVPSAGGVSHDPSEHTAWEDCVNGANVLLGATVELARSL
jgi:N-carbamoyl-L-amino-acid hydrolase